jgi:hypothetical protein
MRVELWNPEMYDLDFENVAIERIVEAAEYVASVARANCKPGTVSRPIYKRGPYAGESWTARDAGALRKTIRVRQKHSKSGKPLKRKRNVRVYAGNYNVYYAGIVEFAGKTYMRTAIWNSTAKINQILGAEVLSNPVKPLSSFPKTNLLEMFGAE